MEFTGQVDIKVHLRGFNHPPERLSKIGSLISPSQSQLQSLCRFAVRAFVRLYKHEPTKESKDAAVDLPSHSKLCTDLHKEMIKDEMR